MASQANIEFPAMGFLHAMYCFNLLYDIQKGVVFLF